MRGSTQGCAVLKPLHNKLHISGWIGLTILAAMVAVALVGPYLTPYDPQQTVGRPFDHPSFQHLLGTNDLGQDLLSEIIVGTRASLLVGLSAALGAVGIGLLVGLIAGYYGGWIDSLLMRVVDLVLVLPFLPLVIVIAAYVGPSLLNLILLIVLISWVRPARVVRSSVMAVREMSYIEAAQALGASTTRILGKHILPAVWPMALAQLIGITSSTILIEASLSFLGLGDPTQKSWGSILYYAQIRGAFLNGSWPWWVLPPGLLITLCVLSFALIGRSLERYLMPRLP